MNVSSGTIKNTYKSYLKKGKQGAGAKLKSLSKQKINNLSETVKSAAGKLKDLGKEAISTNAQTLTKAVGISTDLAQGLAGTILDIKPSSKEEDSESKSKIEESATLKKADEDEKKTEPKEDTKIEDRNNEIIKRSRIRPPTERGELPPIRKPALFFIKGFEFLGMSSKNDGMEQLAEAFKNAEVFEWDQKEEMIHLISRRPKDQPIILVGHSFGGDTAVEISNELNNLNNRFRQVDLLVTLDSVGMNNDIISSNVVKNLNFLTENRFLGDEPNIAKNADGTLVLNELVEDSHTDLDESGDIQSKIVNEIDRLLIQ